MVRSRCIQLSSVEFSDIKPSAVGAWKILFTLLDSHADPLSPRNVLGSDGIGDDVPDPLGGGLGRGLCHHGQLDAGIGEPELRAIFSGGTRKKVVVSLNQAWDNGPLAHVYGLGSGPGQPLHLLMSSQGHDPFPLDGHRFKDISRGIGDVAPVIHADNLPIHQNGVGIAHVFYQSGIVLGQARSRQEQPER